MSKTYLSATIVSAALLSSCAMTTPAPEGSLTLQEQGSFAVGGTVVQAPGTFDPVKQGVYSPQGVAATGQTLHGDHAYVFYQVPEHAHQLPLVFWHGYGQFSKTWETTPDGREGFQNIFLRQHYPIYLLDQPRRGNAGRSTVPGTLAAKPDEQLWFGIFRLGIWPNFYPGVQVSQTPEAMNQFFRQMVPDTGPFDANVNISAVSALFDKIGNGILVTHSHSGGMGWQTAMKNPNIRAIISYEPGSNFSFPDSEMPEPMPYTGGIAKAVRVPMDDFIKLTKIPIIVYYGDNIAEAPSDNSARDQWRVSLAMARKWAEVVNRHGGDATIVHLPEIGIRGNTHFPFADLNNRDVAKEMSKFLHAKHLDK
jgi:hypothetical protein